MLTFPEELMLLLLDDTDGDFLPVAEGAIRYALSGAVLMDLALANRIDTDLDSLTLIDPTPMDDELLDPTLAVIAASSERSTPRYWVETIANDAVSIREAALARLVRRGILERQDERFLWVFRSPPVSGCRRNRRTRGEAPDHGRAVLRRDPGARVTSSSSASPTSAESSRNWCRSANSSRCRTGSSRSERWT